MRLRLLLAALAAVLLALSASSSAAGATKWLCKPGKSPNPCATSLTTTVYKTGNRKVDRIEKTPLAGRRAKVDCFYVYPTVSSDPDVNSDRRLDDPEEKAIASYQASRFSQTCRVFAPLYRQITLSGLLNPSSVTPENRAIAYGDVRAAWKEYLAKFNKGRPFVFLSHSQGTFMLRELIANEVDGNAKLRKRMVAAVLMGGDVLVKKGSDRGGDFKNIRACRQVGQLGCVVAWSIYNETPPADSRFGIPSAEEKAGGLEVLCTDPRAILGSDRLESYIRSDPFPGVLGTQITAQFGEFPSPPTPWFTPGDKYTGRCSSAGGADVLQIKGIGKARRFKPAPDATWGLHLADMNLPLGNLTQLVDNLATAYTAR